MEWYAQKLEARAKLDRVWIDTERSNRDPPHVRFSSLRKSAFFESLAEAVDQAVCIELH